MTDLLPSHRVGIEKLKSEGGGGGKRIDIKTHATGPVRSKIYQRFGGNIHHQPLCEI